MCTCAFKKKITHRIKLYFLFADDYDETELFSIQVTPLHLNKNTIENNNKSILFKNGETF